MKTQITDWNNKADVLEEMRKYGYNLNTFSDASEALRNDKEFVLLIVAISGGALRYASKRLRNDKEVVLTAVRNSGGALEYASKRLRNDKEVVLTAVSTCGVMLKDASKELRNDKDVVLEAVRNDWKALKYISLELQNDNEILLAVSNQLNTEYTIERILQTASEYNTKNIYSVLERLEWEHIKKYLKNW